MSEIIVKEVEGKKELLDFIKFPHKLYEGNPYYVPSFISEDLETLNKEKNPAFKDAEANYFLAYRDGKIVGRIAAIVSWPEVKEQQKPKMRFGWFDMIDDIEVTRKLIDKVVEIGKSHGLKYIEGPVGFSNLDKAGLLTYGFDKIATLINLYNHPYYEEHLTKLGLEKANEWIEYEMDMPKTLPPKVVKFISLIKERYKLRAIRFKTKQELMPYVDQIFGLLEKSYGALDTYVPIKPEQIELYKAKYIKFINPHFVNCVVDDTGKLVAFAITMPSYSKAIQKAKGRLFPFGWYHLWRASKKNDKAEFYLIGIDPKYQGKGVTALIFEQTYISFNEYNIKHLETNPQLEDNKSIHVLWESYDPKLNKKRKTFRKDI